jgi:nucleoside-diphosphate-sugar epimerase
MVTVAVAGGTGKVGRTIVEAIIAAGKHQVIVLSREVSFTICDFQKLV